ncbi:Trm112 family protein [Knoellia sp. LjRoot47]|uniref:Trm112 family protein n=1 Tax=Knoellia sp. LjRoot47 TaxID=3342330 RepID=UPI003ECEEFD3
MSTMEPWLREILRCPNCRAELRDETGADGPELACTSETCGLVYRIDDGVPVLLVDEGRKRA